MFGVKKVTYNQSVIYYYSPFSLNNPLIRWCIKYQTLGIVILGNCL